MTFDDLRVEVRREPFVPFRLFLTDGTTFDIRHPELFMLGRRSVLIGLTSDPEQPYYDRYTTVDLLHIIRTESLRVPAPQNGVVPPS